MEVVLADKTGNQKYTILVADDEPNIRRVLQALFEKSGYQVLVAENGKKAVEAASNHPIDVLISDLIMQDMSGVDVMRAVKQKQPHCAMIMITAYGTIKTAVDAMRLGAYDYLTKPFDLDVVTALVARALDDHGLVSERPVGGPAKRRAAAPDISIVGDSEPMRELMATVRRVADSRATVLIRGESGTGMELIAKALHRHSARAHRAFIAVSCAALPETLLESELFGYEKGAFTGAAGQKPGRFELANDGTLFLDEVGDIPPSLQVKLLRVIQEREFERIGGTRSIQVNVRLIAATNRNLEKLVAEGKFRDDLYFRLQVIQLVVPTLRERRDDIEPLARHFMKRYNLENGRKLAAIAPEALDLLKRYRFPGNVRELENAIERASVMADRDATVLTPDLLPLTIQRYADAYDPD